MNDPHVVALIYKIVHGPNIHYDNADPTEHEAEGFFVKIEGEIVRFEMKKHCASKEEAQETCDEYIQAWEVSAGLDLGPSAFNLKYDGIEIVDRKSTPETVKREIHDTLDLRDGGLKIKRIYSHNPPPLYPPSPPEIKITPDVRRMYNRFQGYRSGKEPLASMAYFCLDVLEVLAGSNNRRNRAARYYNIDRDILREIGKLSSISGGENARKAEGRGIDFTDQERCFLEKAIKKIILRVGEKSKNPNQNLPLISLSDLKK